MPCIFALLKYLINNNLQKFFEKCVNCCVWVLWENLRIFAFLSHGSGGFSRGNCLTSFPVWGVTLCTFFARFTYVSKFYAEKSNHALAFLKIVRYIWTLKEKIENTKRHCSTHNRMYAEWKTEKCTMHYNIINNKNQFTSDAILIA